MKAHQLARKLLAGPDVPVVVSIKGDREEVIGDLVVYEKGTNEFWPEKTSDSLTSAHVELT